MRFTKDELEDLEIILDEYLDIFAKKKAHQKADKKELCDICESGKAMLKKIRKRLEKDGWVSVFSLRERS